VIRRRKKWSIDKTSNKEDEKNVKIPQSSAVFEIEEDKHNSDLKNENETKTGTTKDSVIAKICETEEEKRSLEPLKVDQESSKTSSTEVKKENCTESSEIEQDNSESSEIKIEDNKNVSKETRLISEEKKYERKR